KSKGNIDRHDTYLLAVGTNEANFWDADTVVCTWIANAVLLVISQNPYSGRKRSLTRKAD
ncbi:MAG: hypothetical protein RLY59_1312, partial [Actinomycetota bacterium]